MKVLSGAALAFALVAGGTVWPHAADNKEKTRAEIKELMKQTCKGEDSPLGRLSKELKADEPSWEEVRKQVRELSALSAALGDCKDVNNPGRKRYQQTVADLDAAVAKKDKTAASEARRAVLGSCAACHRGGPPPGTGGGRN